MIRLIQLVILMFVSPAFAFNLTDHSTITEIAFKEFHHCYSDRLNSKDLELLISANRYEDINLVGKFFGYSHYHHPLKTLSSSVRKHAIAKVKNLEAELISIEKGHHNSRTAFLELLGSLMHFAQDVASPTHVTPITHGVFDSFEQFEQQGTLPSNEDCDDFYFQSDNGLDGEFIFTITAMFTLGRIRYEKFPASLKKGQPLNSDTSELSWTGFWQESNDETFGTYGALGDTFGNLKIVSGDSEYEVSFDVYNEFKKNQMRLAANATKQLLYRFVLTDRFLKLQKTEPTVGRSAVGKPATSRPTVGKLTS